jgi:hypothetical protein
VGIPEHIGADLGERQLELHDREVGGIPTRLIAKQLY